MKRTILVLLAILMIAALVSCGNAKPDTEIPKDDDTPVEDITPLPPEEKPKEITAEEAYDLLKNKILGYCSSLISERKDYLPTASIDLCQIGMKKSELKDAISIPHFVHYSKDGNTILDYVLEDGKVFVVTLEYLTQEVTTSWSKNVTEYIENSPDVWWERDAVTASDPQETYDFFNDALNAHKWVEIGTRRDYVDPIKTKYLATYMPFSKVQELLGEPHFVQTEKEKPSGSTGGAYIHNFYILSDGTALMIDIPTEEYTDAPTVYYFMRTNAEDCAIKMLAALVY